MPITFAVIASSKAEAAQIARGIPRVKHDRKDAIQMVREVSFEWFFAQLQENNRDPYLNITNRRQHVQMLPLFQERIVEEPRRRETRPTDISLKNIYIRKERIRYPRKYTRMQGELIG